MLNLRIADVDITVQGDINEYFIERTKSYAINDSTINSGNKKININFKFVPHIEKPFGKVITSNADRTWYYPEGADYAYYDINLETGQVIFDAKIKDNDINITVYDFHDEPEKDLTYPLLNSTDMAARICLRNFDRFALHASAIEFNGYGLAFSAKSGTGKSTHTSLWQKSYPYVKMINDDSPIIRFEDEETYIYGSPWAGSTGINTNIKVPLKAIIFLEQAPENSIEKADSLTCLKKIITNMTIPMDKKLAEKAYDSINKLITSTNCYLLKCTPDERAVEVVKNCIANM